MSAIMIAVVVLTCMLRDRRRPRGVLGLLRRVLFDLDSPAVGGLVGRDARVHQLADRRAHQGAV